VAYDRSDAREQRRNELAARLADARRRAGISRGSRWQGAVAPVLATGVLLAVTPDVLRVAHGGRSELVAAGRILVADASRAVRASRLGVYVDEPPVADGAADLSTAGPVVLVLGGRDPDGDPLTATIVTAPRHGTLTQQGVPVGASASLGPVLYTPTPGFAGDDELVFTVSDGTLASAPVVRRITVYALSPAERGSAGRHWRRAGERIPDFSLQRPEDFQRTEVTPDYLLRAQELLDAAEGRPPGQPRDERFGDGREGRVSADHGISLPPLVPTSDL
jgi:hypothetical protein